LHVLTQPTGIFCTDLWCTAYVLLDKSRVGVVLDVVSVNEVFQVVEPVFSISTLKLQNTHLEYVHLQPRQFTSP